MQAFIVGWFEFLCKKFISLIVQQSTIMGSQGKKLREKLFDIYATNLSTVEPETKGIFRCPMCLKDFDRSALEVDQKLTFGHVIPEAVGGRIFTLECGACNHNIGGTYDSHVDKMKKLLDWIRRREGTKKLVHIKEGESDTAAYLLWEKGQMAVIKATNWDDPNYQTSSKRLGSQLKQGSFKFTITADSNLNCEWTILSAIHSAFLMMFYCFGYEYILSPEADIVRKIIHERKAPWEIGKMIKYVPIAFVNDSNKIPSAGVITEPKEMKSFVVILPCFSNSEYFQVISLPGFRSKKTFYNFMNSKNRTTGMITFTTINDGPWPKGICKAIWNGT
jgi:hypothetical protein